MTTLHQTTIRFPEVKMTPRQAAKLRGFFGNLFKEQSPLLNNHLASGDLLYRYPLVQYKVLQNIPVLVGLNEGADLLTTLFLKMKHLDIDGHRHPILQKNIESKQLSIGISTDLHAYQFETLWMALSQKNYKGYQQEDDSKRQQHLKSLLIGNILTFCKGVNYRVQGNVMANLKITGQQEILFKDTPMLTFKGSFVTNMLLPEGVGIGKQASRGFGTVRRN